MQEITLDSGRKVQVSDESGVVRLVVDGAYAIRSEDSLYAGSDGGPARIIRLESK